MRMPVRKTFVAIHIAASTAAANTMIVARISPAQISEPADNRNIMTIGVIGGKNDKLLARVPFESWTILCQARSGMMQKSMTGVIRLWVSLIVLQTEPIPTMVEPNNKKARM